MNGDNRRDPNRKSGGGNKFPEKNGNYSPSTDYNYSPSSSFNAQHQQHPRRRNDRYRRDMYGSSEKLVKQNDTIIRLLKEIRDRLPRQSAPESGSHDDTGEGNSHPMQDPA